MDIIKQRQKLKHDCALTALSMVTGEEYDSVAEYFDGIDFDKGGITYYALNSFLFDHGFSTARIFKYKGFKDCPQRTPWPPEPFADMHICEVLPYESSTFSHFIVMLRDGKIFDPAFSEIKKLSDYHKVYNVAGVYKID